MREVLVDNAVSHVAALQRSLRDIAEEASQTSAYDDWKVAADCSTWANRIKDELAKRLDPDEPEPVPWNLYVLLADGDQMILDSGTTTDPDALIEEKKSAEGAPGFYTLTFRGRVPHLFQR